MVKVGRMKKRVLLFLVGCAVTVGLACSTHPAKPLAKTAPAPGLNPTSGGARVIALKSELTPEPRIMVRTDGEPAFISYSPQPDVFVIDFPKAAKQPDLSIPTNLPPFIASIAADEAVELDRNLTRVTVRFTQPVTARGVAAEDGVWVTFDPVVQVASTDVNDIPVAPAEPVAVVEVSATAAVEPAPEEVLPSNPATMLKGISTTGSGLTLQVLFDADGALDYKAFRLADPTRLVIDLNGIRNKVRKSAIQLGDPYVARIRVSQFKPMPEPVTRVVLDLDEIVDYRVERAMEGLRIAFGEAPASLAPAVTVAGVADDSQGTNGSNGTNGANGHEQAIFAPEPSSPEMVASMQQTLTMTASPQATTPVPSQTRAADVQSTVRQTPTEDVFLAPQEEAMTGGMLRPGERRDIGPGERAYTGEPITLTLKDADIKDVLRTFAQLTGLNIAIDPQVTGTVTVQFENVPWDQALELILRQNGLDYILTGNVMRIGTVDRLAQEQQQRRRLQDEERLNVPLQTIIRRLSYAKASDVQTLARELASPRGRIIVDPRTNQLIITDVPQYIPTILSLIENVDIPTPQVVIEARIVETTKNFAQQLGIRWNFLGTLDPALGTGTGLAFPNRVGVVGGPFNFAAGAPDVLRFTLSDVLGTFDLDVALTAAENEGLVRIVSAPKVTTQDNQAAEISSGVQVPVQTRVNFTTTTTYVDATLRLEVTPQITAADTVIMQINVTKTEPGPLPEGATAPPLNTRRATTRVMVRDGGTTVIGGIYQATENRNENRVPFIHQVPIIGNLFKGRNFSTRHDELLIFITPRIVRAS